MEDYEKFFLNVADTDYCDALLGVNEDKSYEDIPLHFAVQVV